MPVKDLLERTLRLCLCALVLPCVSSVAQTTQPHPPAPAFNAAAIGTGTREIDGNWAFHLGDDPAYAQPAFNDSAWERLPLDGPWGDHGHPYQTGFAWYRRSITIGPSEKLALYLPELDSVAEVYWNGQLAGSSGHMPPQQHWYFFARPVAISLPTTAAETSGTLAIRVWKAPLSFSDSADSEGLQSGPILGDPASVTLKVNYWYSHLFASRAIGCAVLWLSTLASLFCLILWARAPRQWVYLCLGGYYVCYVAEILIGFFPLRVGFISAQAFINLLDPISDTCIWFLLLWLFELRTRFWIRLVLVMTAVDFFINAIAVANLALIFRNPGLFYKMDSLLNPIEYALPLFIFVPLMARFRSRPRGAGVFLGLAVAADALLQLCDAILKLVDAHAPLDWLRAPLLTPLFTIYGSSMSKFMAGKLLLLFAGCYAVWDYMNAERRRQRLLHAELKSAQEVQQILVPDASHEEVSGFAIESIYRPASEVGGDFFQVIPLPADKTLIVAGDVSGKGLRAAMTVSLIVGALRTLAEHDPSPAAILSGLNRRLIGRTQGGFVTACAILLSTDGNATFSNAGHCQPYLNGAELTLPAGLPLGITPLSTYEETTLTLPHSMHLALISDGVLEARNREGELYGFDRLTRLMQTTPTADSIAQTAINFGQDDDITVLTIRRATA